ncbi:MAG TPA: hypothetical protein VH413_09355 [Verrucomicrobiae bacterium]|jgi:hypothetical protein|nr:hypothetical protein [Verrucomicrobiae bacterium]
MRWFLVVCCSMLVLGSTANAADGRVLKVLPQFLDLQGREAITPSLYDRDAYQAILRKNPKLRSGIRFAIQWKANAPATEVLKLRVEMRGTPEKDLPKESSIEMEVHQHHWFSHWAYIKLGEDKYKALGEVTAWRVTLWDGDKLLSEQKSFLW